MIMSLIFIVRSVGYNPLTEINFADNQATNNSIIGSLGFKYEFSEKLTIDVNGGIDRSDVHVERRQGPQTLEGVPDGRSQLSEQLTNNYVFNGWATYTRKWLATIIFRLFLEYLIKNQLPILTFGKPT